MSVRSRGIDVGLIDVTRLCCFGGVGLLCKRSRGRVARLFLFAGWWGGCGWSGLGGGGEGGLVVSECDDGVLVLQLDCGVDSEGESCSCCDQEGHDHGPSCDLCCECCFC